jgi:dTMP kinase
MTRGSGQGRFITLEGGEGAGKSTLARALKERFEAMGSSVVLTREPGGSPGAEILRHVLLSGAAAPLGPFAEAILFAAARDDHLESTIRPALARGDIVISDRFADSTRAYQGAGGGVEPPVLDALERIVVGRTRPDLTLVLDIDADAGLSRARRRTGEVDRFETEDIAFHQRLRQAFLDIARRHPERCVVIDARRAPEEVATAAWSAIRDRLQRGGTTESR